MQMEKYTLYYGSIMYLSETGIDISKASENCWLEYKFDDRIS